MDAISVFDLPYFVQLPDEEEPLSRAAQLLRAINEGGTVGKVSAALSSQALHDLLLAEAALCNTEHDKRYLSEAVLSAMSIGLGIAGTPVGDSISLHQRKAAKGRHREDRAMKADVIKWYRLHGREFESQAAAARHIVETIKLVPLEITTVERYLTGIVPK